MKNQFVVALLGSAVFLFSYIAPFWELTPDIQIVKNPANNPNEDQVMILGLRTRLVW